MLLTTIKNLKAIYCVFAKLSSNCISISPKVSLVCYIKFRMFMPLDMTALSLSWYMPYNVLGLLNNVTDVLPYLLGSSNLATVSIMNHWFLS